MTTLIVWFVMAYGLSNILVYGSIFAGIRNRIARYGDSGAPFSAIVDFVSGILSCMMCCSTWVGFLFSFLVFSPINQYFGVSPYFAWFLDGMLASGAVWAINSIIEYFEENRIQKNN